MVHSFSLGRFWISQFTGIQLATIQRTAARRTAPQITMALWPRFAILSFALLAFALLLMPGIATADVKKWVEPNGVVHYGDWAPPEADAASVKVRANVIDTHQDLPPVASEKQSVKREKAPEPVSASTADYDLREDVIAYIKQCRQNRGVNCIWEAFAMIYGPAPVLFPGDPAVFPRPDLKPPPPGLSLKYRPRGLSLKYSITP
jgi:hypothetical protein